MDLGAELFEIIELHRKASLAGGGIESLSTVCANVGLKMRELSNLYVNVYMHPYESVISLKVP